tara:strand:+ start:40 stop:282 length:243 start_codon:yes stop_codon:yes gene_type:complete
MKNSTINKFYIIQSIIAFYLVYLKTEIWWYGLIGTIILPVFSGLLEGLSRKKSGSPFFVLMYPRYFFISTLILVLYYFVF